MEFIHDWFSLKYFYKISGARATNKESNNKTSTSENPFPCPTCPKSYKSKTSLAMHLKYQCGREPQFLCPFCSHRTYLKGNMKQHCVLKHHVVDFDFGFEWIYILSKYRFWNQKKRHLIFCMIFNKK